MSERLRRSITVGIAGGSGAIYALRLIEILRRYHERVDVVLSNAARQVLDQEAGAHPPDEGEWNHDAWSQGDGEIGRVVVWKNQNFNAPFASGSNCADQMVVVPCSMSTVAAIAHGIDQNLLHHAAAVTIKEGKKLIVVPRETPLSAIHLRNLLTLAEVGVAVVPAMPGFYGGQSTFDDLIDFVLQKIINQLGIDLRLSRRWGEESTAA